MQVRRNTRAFKTIVDIVARCQRRPDREKLIRLYITRAGHTIQDRISVEGIRGGDAALFYDMNYDAVLSNLKSSTHQLHASDELNGVYFFHTASSKTWDIAPFEFDDAVLKEFSTLDELPRTRKKNKVEKTVLPVTREVAVPGRSKINTADTGTSASASSKQRTGTRDAPKGKVHKGPNFNLRREIEFTNTDKIVYVGSRVSRLGVLTYYHRIAAYLLPYLKDRLLSTRQDVESARAPILMTTASWIAKDDDRLPGWIRHHTHSAGKTTQEAFLCNDKEHLLLYVELGCVAFQHSLSRIRTPTTPDFLVISIDSPGFELNHAIEVALGAKQILDGLQLRAGIMTDGLSGLHIYINLDGKCGYGTTYAAAGYLCRLIKLKLPDQVSIHLHDDVVYGKVIVDYSCNAAGANLIAPYSLAPGASAIVATPLQWDEVKPGLRAEDFTHESIFERLKQHADPFMRSGKKINAEDLLKRLEKNYSFLF